MEDDQAAVRCKQVPQQYRSPERPRQASPHRWEQASTASADVWTSPTGRSSPFVPNSRVPAPIEVDARRVEPRPSLPTLPPPPALVAFDREAVSLPAPRDYGASSVLDRRPAYRTPDYGYGHHHPGRYQSLSMSSIRPQDRTPFSAGGGFNAHYQDMSRQGEAGGDAKQRKRRGSLPKETTDKLRAWFVGHLQHPYPTEDEKQELMRQTGLQMSKSSGRPRGRGEANERANQTKSPTGSSMLGGGSCRP